MTNKKPESTDEFTSLEKTILKFIFPFFLFIGISIIGISIYLFIHKENLFIFHEPINSDKFSHFGGFVGGIVGCLWSLLSILLFYITLQLQRKELRLQRLDLELTRKELEGQKEELKTSNTNSNKQLFDSKFFQLLNLHNQILNSIDFTEDSKNILSLKNIKGIFFFKELSRRIANYFFSTLPETKKDFGNEKDQQKLLNIYRFCFNGYRSVLGHYFRNLYHIVRIIDESIIISDSDKEDYMKILRAQLSNYELVLLAYNGISPQGEKFYPLINTYELLKNIDLELNQTDEFRKTIIDHILLIAAYPHLETVYKAQLELLKND
jgi:hypothetical protein